MISCDAVAGCIVGGAIGDVLGGIGERRSLSLSDDTQLTLATCEAILATRDVTPESIAARMLAWFREGRISGIGSSTLKAMRDLDAGAHWALAGARGERAAGNGAAMRIAPVAFFLDPFRPADRTKIRDISRITHHHDEAYLGALAVVIAVRSAAAGATWSAASIADALPDGRVRDHLNVARQYAGKSLEEVAGAVGSSGFTPETVALALEVTGRIISDGFEPAIYALNAVGGDTDTIGSIAGQIAGAAAGIRALPVHLLNDVPNASDVLRIADELAAFASH